MSSVVAVKPVGSAMRRVEQLLHERHAVLSGLPTIIAQTFFLSASPLREDVVLWLCRSQHERDQLAYLLSRWHVHRGEDAAAPSVFTFSAQSLRDRALSSLLLEIGGTPRWVLTTTADLRLPLPPPELLEKQVLSLAAGQTCAPGMVAQTLAGLGYERQTLVTQHGMYSKRGGVVDVWPYDRAAPLRLDVLDQTLERITSFNWKTQRNREELSRVRIPPCVLPKTNRATLVTYLRRHADRVRIVAPDRDELETIDPDAHASLGQLSDFRAVTLQPFADEHAAFDVHGAPLFHKNFAQLSAMLTERLREDWTVRLLTSRAYDLRERLGALGRRTIVEVEKQEAELLRGFESARDRLLLLADWEIYGQDEERALRRSERADIVFVAELRPGDFVVHVDHGIGRFVGTTEQTMNGAQREYFVLQYAEDDKLFVPVEMAEKISKYIGVANPRLHRLSGGGWYQMTRKIKEETRATAEELLKLYAQRETVRTIAFGPPTPEERDLAASFPYETTPDQQRAIEDVEHDLRQTTPMDRLICGDVGFGKTEVAIRAAFKAVMNKKQVAILSPTTILTQQHFDTFRERLAKFDVRIDCLSRFRTPKQQDEALQRLRLGQTDIIIGTHRLLQHDVQCKDLGLVIIDEEQRFGVEDKERLKTLRLQAHVLTLTATPIPRTLNFALANIRDITVIETPPEGRKPIETHIEPYHDGTVIKSITRELERRGQTYYVYNHVETIDLRMRELQELVPTARFAVAHGQMPEDQLARVMEDFDRRAVDVLVSSTIIENGLDLPNVNTLVVDHATNFGLAQLYQLRGRIGRGSNQAYAYFLYHSKKLTPEARKRLQALLEARELGSGFQLALRDLEIRGTGSILGTKQHGHVSAVGLTLYARLLAETIRELREGFRAEPARELLIDLPVTIRIPKDMEPNEQKRLSYYQKLALETTVEGLDVRARRLFRRRQLPESIQNLLDVLKLKLLGQQAGVTSVVHRKGLVASDPGSARIIVSFAAPLIPSQIKALIEANGEWQFGENQIKISMAALGKQWMRSLHDTLVLIEQSKHIAFVPEQQ